ncbi:NF-kappa-B essential modulator isoform X2 [Lepisosteus oculatus]|uniref:NF-kappa-B essential modulator n=1 Tax=Lepisosteus oculatus TaxID=7918 RepID=W5NAA1_LEPOC|nr:PREDICTED: NF-kappa-B essential modulator-like isoform X2 [Lepisosteus oculatus]
MVQPKGLMGNELKSDMIGGDGSMGLRGQGSTQIPPELAGNEIVQRLLAENQDLRDAIRQSNQALRDRYEEMLSFRLKNRQERQFLMEKFREARELVERLSRENHLLQGQLNRHLLQNQNHTLSQNPSPSPQSSRQESLDSSSEEGVLEAGVKAARERQPESPPQSMALSSASSSVCSQGTVTQSLFDSLSSEPEQPDCGEAERVRSQPSEGANAFLKLLKAHKEELEESLRELRRRNQLLEKEKEELLSANVQLQSELTQIKDSREPEGGSEEPQGTVTQERLQRANSADETGSELRRKVAQLSEQISITDARKEQLETELHAKIEALKMAEARLEHSETLRKQRDRDLQLEREQSLQLSKDSESVKAQVTSLLAELQESQSCLEKSEQEKDMMEDKLRRTSEALQSLERETEQMKKQHSVATDQLRLQTQSLESALKTERHIVTEEKRKLAQLQHAYTQLFQDYDMRLKNETAAKQRGAELEDLAAQLQEAERALAMKQDLIDKLKEQVEQQRGALETVPVLTAQAEIYKADFLAEREAREKLHEQKEALQEQLAQLQVDRERLLAEGTARARMEEMQQRHLDYHHQLPQQRPLLPPQPGFPGATVPFSPAQDLSLRRRSMTDELPDFCCPKCQYQAPDMDTLQIHVMDCIQ